MANGETQQAPWEADGIHYWSVDYIQAPQEEVFEHLTRGEHTQKYYFGMPISDPQAEGEDLFFGTDAEKSPIRGKVTEYDAPDRFAHTFTFAHAADDPETEVVFELEADGPELTRLVTWHRGFQSRDETTYNDICSGWPAILSGLKSLLETGQPLQWPEPEDTEEG